MSNVDRFFFGLFLTGIIVLMVAILASV